VTAWLLSFGWNWVLIPAAAWFARGVYIAWTRPWLKCVSVSKLKGDRALVTVMRQERLPPWRRIEETWYVGTRQDMWGDRTARAHREGDGVAASTELSAAISGIVLVAIAREQETEELAK
jgi:hypothetical protein